MYKNGYKLCRVPGSSSPYYTLSLKGQLSAWREYIGIRILMLYTNIMACAERRWIPKGISSLKKKALCSSVMLQA